MNSQIQMVKSRSYPPNFLGECKAFCTAKLISTQLEALSHLLPLLEYDTFIYSVREYPKKSIASCSSMLDVLEKLLDNVTFVLGRDKEVFHHAMFRILTRKEWDLRDYVNSTERLRKAPSIAFLNITASDKAIRVLHRYSETLAIIGEYSVKLLDRVEASGISQSQLEFSLKVLVLLFFRFPASSACILDAFSCNSSDSTFVPEILDSNQFVSDNPSLFYWAWFTPTPKTPPSFITKLGTLRLNSQLMQFTGYFVAHVCDTAHGRVVWDSIPAATGLLRNYLALLKESPELSGPAKASLMDTGLCRDVLPNIVTTLISSTRVTPTDVGSLLTTLDNVFNLCLPGTPVNSREFDLSSGFPSTFCFGMLEMALDMLLSSEHYQILSKTLWFIYRHSGRLYGRSRSRVLGKMLLEKRFFSLFTHWSSDVRSMFVLILVFRLDRGFPLPTSRPLSKSMHSSSHRGSESQSRKDSMSQSSRAMKPAAFQSAPSRRRFSMEDPALLPSTSRTSLLGRISRLLQLEEEPSLESISEYAEPVHEAKRLYFGTSEELTKECCNRITHDILDDSTDS